MIKLEFDTDDDGDLYIKNWNPDMDGKYVLIKEDRFTYLGLIMSDTSLLIIQNFIFDDKRYGLPDLYVKGVDYYLLSDTDIKILKM
jgi:hypothetical protein